MNRGNEQRLVERRDRGVIRHASSVYGSSVEGIPLTVYLPDDGSAEIVVLASIHGDEAETTVVVSEALRCIPRDDLHAAVILCGNPDGRKALPGTGGVMAPPCKNSNTRQWFGASLSSSNFRKEKRYGDQQAGR